MKCLSIQQPWGQYIAAGLKDVENRPWGLKNFPQRVLIHVGKKLVRKDYAEMPLCLHLIIENAENLGIVPLPDEMLLGAIIGVVDIVGCTVNNPESSIWAGVSPDPERPCYNLHLANARLFKQPIEGVKGKLGIFEYPNIMEDNLPETIDIPSIRREGKELFVPVHPDLLEIFESVTDEGVDFAQNLNEANKDLFVEFTDEEVLPLLTDYITFFDGQKSVRVKVIDSETVTICDDDDPIEYSDPAGNNYVWMKIFYTVVPETSRRRRKSIKANS